MVWRSILVVGVQIWVAVVASKALALYFVEYNFCSQNKSFRIRPALATGVFDMLHDMDWIMELIEERSPKPGRMDPIQKRLWFGAA